MKLLLLLFPISSLIVAAVPSSAFAPTTRSISSNVTPQTQRVGHSQSTHLHLFAPLDEVAALASSTQPFLEGAFNSASTSSSLDVASGIFDSENIKTAFSVATFFPQLPWLFLILLPNTGVTKKLLGGYEIITLCCLVHFFIVSASIVQPDGTAPMAEFADVFDPSGDPQKAMVGMMQYPNFVTEEWSHVLTWDLFVGRWIWLDGLRRGIFTSHSVLLCNLIGPPGLLLHWLTCILTGKGLPGNEATSLEEMED
mmetsp:Transcript_2139/g.4571  ORF Transcript_2139/g.4571 Transcript_2139/m.4571 type:complete len:254 (+) Transcript_2139:107-868(+)